TVCPLETLSFEPFALVCLETTVPGAAPTAVFTVSVTCVNPLEHGDVPPPPEVVLVDTTARNAWTLPLGSWASPTITLPSADMPSASWRNQLPAGQGTAWQNGVVTPRFCRTRLSWDIFPVALVQMNAVNSEIPLTNGSPAPPTTTPPSPETACASLELPPSAPRLRIPVGSHRVASRFPLSLVLDPMTTLPSSEQPSA